MDDCTKGPQLEEDENLNTGAPRTGRTPPGVTSALVGKAQEGPSPAFVKKNIDVLRTMIKELDNRGQKKVTPRKLFNEKSGGVGSKNSQMSPSTEEVRGYSSDRASRSKSRGRAWSARKNQKSVSKKKGISKSHRSVRSEARSRLKSKSAKSKPQSVRASRRKSSSHSGITRFRYRRRAKLPPNVRVYEGNKDSKDHLSIFSAASEQEEWHMPVWCKMFRQTVSGLARNWFDSLDPKSVDGFEELSNKFWEEFSQQKMYDKDPTEIHGIKRKPNEGLQAFMDRFKAENAHIKGVPSVLRIYTFMHGHGHPGLAKKLNDKIPKTIDEMWERVRAFIEGETTADTTEVIRSPRWEKNASKARWSEGQNVSRNRGHRRGKEGAWGHERGSSGERYQARWPKEQGLSQKNEKVINMVRSQGYRKRSYERVEHWMDNAITFPSVPRYQLMNCPVVVEAMIEGFKVRRIHVNGGSSSEVMYEHCFKNLSYRTRSRLRESRIPLVGFSGEVSYPMGVIDLEVTMGECEKTRTVILEFMMVKSPSPYTALLSRTRMGSLGAVASTIQSMMKFLTSNEIATISTTIETLR
nr:reverse transcriptase domain-containing protein [Tanacetum cinerariifolium]